MQEHSITRRRARPLRSAARGFTVYETLVTLAILSALYAAGVSAAGLLQDTALSATANDLILHLNLARSEAIKRRVDVILCPSADEHRCLAPTNYTWWQSGWIVYADANDNGRPDPGEVIRSHRPSAGGYTIRTSRARAQATYHPTGFAGGSALTFALCSPTGDNLARYVIVSNTGRPRAARSTISSMQCH